MKPIDAETCYAHLLARFEHQPISPDQRDGWREFLVQTVPSVAVFDDALRRCVRAGGSTFAPMRGKRPGIAEFAALVQAVIAEFERKRSDAERQLERIDDGEWPDHAAYVKTKLDQIRTTVPATNRRRKAHA